MDPTIIGTGLAVLASKDVLNKLLGPTADYVGGEMKGLVEKCNVNIGSILARAVKRLGTRLDEPGQVSPRILTTCSTGWSRRRSTGSRSTS
jgi:hypothetical protein